MSTFETYASVLSRFNDIQDFGEYRKAKCPSHADEKHSLSIAIGEKGHLVLKCHAGCGFQEIVSAAGIRVQETFAGNTNSPPRPSRPRISNTYPYRDESGNYLYEVVRFEPKDFRPRRRPTESDDKKKIKNGYVWNLQNVSRVLYRLDELKKGLAAKSDRIVFVVEGEKDVDLLCSFGLLATTNVGGAGKWLDEYTETLRGCNVVVIPDNDPRSESTGRSAGMDHAELVKTRLEGVASRVEVVTLDGLPDKGDVSDWFSSGGTLPKFKEIIQKALKGKGGEEVIQKKTGEYEHITLSSREINSAATVGIGRRTQFMLKNSSDAIGWEYSIENACGELAVAKASQLYWDGHLQDTSGNSINVRVRQNEDHDLIVKDTDNKDSWYVFVTGRAPEFKIWGAIWGESVSESGHKVSGGVMVSKSDLESISCLLS